jgi:protoheme IX farnesyltransferase
LKARVKENNIAISPVFSAMRSFGLLVKFKLTITVLFSSVLDYLIASTIHGFSWEVFLLLGLGGFFITSAANALNEVLEKDYDKLMKRTAGRPLPSGDITTATAVLMAGLMALFGTIFLGLIGPLVAFMGMISLLLYAFIYTPLKRYSPASVMIGAVPGALPAAIGVVAAAGSITELAIILFAIQFFWQFPHFWAIAWLADEDYKKAGFQLLPCKSGRKDAQTGLQSFVYAILLILSCVPLLFFGYTTIFGFVLILLLSAGYALQSWNLYKTCTDKAARKQMFYSFAYLPVAFLIVYIGQII